MIREIINFTTDVMKDQEMFNNLIRKIKPSNGLHIFVELDAEGKWKNKAVRYGVDYVFYTDDNGEDAMRETCIQYENYGRRVGWNMNKVLDSKKLSSCSPFILSFKKKTLTDNTLEGTGYQKIDNLLPSYFKKARDICLKNADETLKQLSKAFEQVCSEVLQQLTVFSTSKQQKDGSIVQVPIVEEMENEHYIHVYLKNISLEKYKEAHENYLQEKLFNTNKHNNEKNITKETYGVSNFLNGLNSKKPFLEHKTAMLYKGISERIQLKDAIALNYFEILISNRILPNPLPIVIDKDELNRKIVNLFNSNDEPIPYQELMKELFKETNRDCLANFYLIQYAKTKKGLKINDFDFVPLFRFNLEKDTQVYNLTHAEKVKEKTFETAPDINLPTVFKFEKDVVKEIFNIKDDAAVNYFGDINPAHISDDNVTYQQIRKYRKAFYDFIYKSKRNAINTAMFDDMMYHSILSNIQTDGIKGRFEWNNTIKKKLNIWFSLYTLFNNNLKENEMASKVPDLMAKMSSVAKGETNFETPEEFAFGAGQLVSYLINQSAAANKTYAMLEPYLQKNKSNQLQDTIAQTIAVYKHAIGIYHGKFERLATQVLTDNSDVEMKPLMKYFLAGCFCPCVIYESDKNEETNN